jgi:transposase
MRLRCGAWYRCWRRFKVFGFGAATRIYLAPGATDMRKGFEGLYGLVRDCLQCSPLSGHIFLFCNAQRNRLKLLVWDGTGLWVCAKKLSRGRFRWPQPRAGEVKVVLSAEELVMLLGGIDLSQARYRAWYRSQIDNDGVDSDRINTEQNDCIPQLSSAT